MSLLILQARSAGACYGVERAISLVEEALEQGKQVYTLGSLIHNPLVVRGLEERGVQKVESLDQTEEGILVIRSHGVAPQVIQEAKERGLEVVDATCPHVEKAQQAAFDLKLDGYMVIILGEKGHPEVEGICGYAGQDALVVQTVEELPEHLPSSKVGVVVQTTQTREALDTLVQALDDRVEELKVCNTICSATRRRQDSARELAAEVDVMVVLGGLDSGNTTRLASICSEICPAVYHVEDSAQIKASWFQSAQTVGITAGASTPHDQIDQAIARIEELCNV